jgi:DNA polymerase III subunit epsilon
MKLGLRLRGLLFFAALALAAIGIVVAALVLQAGRASQGDGGLVAVGIMAGFGLFGLICLAWLLFDQTIAKPATQLAAAMQARAVTDMRGAIAGDMAPHLGDLAPAAAALSEQLGDLRRQMALTLARRTARLTDDKDRLTRILSAIPAAVIMVGPDHRITLYDGHAAMMLDDLHHLGLGQRIFDYFDETYLQGALQNLRDSGVATLDQQLVTADGGRLLDVCLHDLGGDGSYMLSFAVPRTSPPARPVVYDFERQAVVTGSILERPLRALTYVVFDTETTGLRPDKDDIVQIGGLRVVNGQQAPGEVFDQLVNPRRPIPPRSTSVHGITDAMVANAPDIITASRKFHSFARDAVLVAHNAPFDMAFFQRHAKQIGVTFDHPVLDTVLLSAILFGGTEGHTLDALALRLDVDLSQAMRHTALGDAIATRDVFLRMIPMLEQRGLTTFGQVLAEMRKHKRLLPVVNDPV